MTIQEVVNSINIKIDNSHLTYIELGKHGMSIPLLIELANFFDVSVDYILKLSDTRKKRDSK